MLYRWSGVFDSGKIVDPFMLASWDVVCGTIGWASVGYIIGKSIDSQK
jgi:hypothetical protein